MPGKVNPVIPEVANQIAFRVIGNELTVTLAAGAGQFDLNVVEPLIATYLFESFEMLKNGVLMLWELRVEGITANVERSRRMVAISIGLVTALTPTLGYDACTAPAKVALDSGRGVYELALEKHLLSREELDRLHAPENMIGPRRAD